MAEQSQSAPEQTKKVLEDLIERFSRNLDAYKSPTYKEDQCRIEFINPFFESLGWDMANKQGFAEQYKEVVHEDTLNMSGLTKAPDYSFRIGGTRKFFLEAKKPAVSIKTDASPAHQLRRYAWSAKLPLSILTDFEEFAVYDCRIKPNEKDKPDAARVRYLTYEQYFDELNWIYATFSKEAILKGSFDRFAESSKGKKGTSEVDAEFLKEIESWRVALAKNIALRNPALNVHQLNDAVQRTIDRIIFLRMAEDRGIENYQQLFGAINGANIYKRLIELFYQSEDKYNSGLFDFKKDSFTTSLKIDDQALADIISDLYYPKCPYEFSVLGADTLGNIYEQFLGKVIRLTAGHQAKIEEKPEVKKAGGVYYTPKYIVDYIVQNTVGKLISGRGTEFSGRDTLVPGQKGISSSLLIRQHDLPHWQAAGSIYFVTFRSARGALPEPALKQVMENISFEEGKKFDLFLAVVMPNHVHMLLQPREIEPGVWHDLGEIMKGIKGVSARRINQMMGTTGEVWQNESFDRIIRDEKEFDQKMEYMIFNPVKAGLVKEPEDYQYFVRGGGFENSRADTLVGQQAMRDKSVPPTESLSPKEISKIKILDPACGSGSFLLGAYQYLLDYHLKFYESQMRDKSRGDTLVSQPSKNLPIYQGPRGQWLLTTSEKKRILLNNIFGVDIDPQAVEVTKLSLLLKVLENESEESLKKQLQLFHERALPDLDNNIKCGNSLIGTDFYQNQQGSLFDDEQKYKINAFDWKTEFKDIFSPSSGPDTPVGGKGFDVVIGNPPYVRQESLLDSKEYFGTHYQVYHGMADLYAYFIEKAINNLKPGGYFSFIVSNKWMRANYAQPLREWMKKQKILSIIDFGDLPVFTGATTYPCILLMSKGKPQDQLKVCKAKELVPSNLAAYIDENCFEVSLKSLGNDGWSLADTQSQNLLDKIKSKGMPLSQYVEGKIYRGILTGLDRAFVIDKTTKDRLIREDKKSAEIIKPFLLGRDIKRYQEPVSARYLIFMRRGIDVKKYPAIEKYLDQYKESLMPKPANWKGKGWEGRKPGSYKWYEIQDSINYYQEFEKPKIIFPEISTKGNFTYDSGNFYSTTTSYIIPVDDLFLLGILNSSLTIFFYKSIASSIRGDYLRFKYQYVAKIPIAQPEKSSRDSIVALVEKMLDLNRKLSSSKTPDEKTRLEREIKATDNQIDQLVYQLYGLTEEEIQIIEGVK